MKLLAVGPLWRGSNAGGLFRAFSRIGCIVDIVDEYYYLSFHSSNLVTKVLQKLIRGFQVREFNNAIIKSLDLFKPDVLFVYKGAFVLPATLQYAKDKGFKLALFYPDVSMTAHGSFLPKNIPFYDVIFTTKTFGINDLKTLFGVTNAHFIPHGFDPDIHRDINLDETALDIYRNDVSFIGTWSPKKEQLLKGLKERLPDIDLKIWGGQWDRSSSEIIRSSIQNTTILGDLYAMAIQASKINLGILAEVVKGASSGDLITSRTFHIPGANGFLLHERTKESVLYFEEGVEAAFYDGVDELVEKVQYYLSNSTERLKIKEAGNQRALKEHSLDMRAKQIISILKDNFN